MKLPLLARVLATLITLLTLPSEVLAIDCSTANISVARNSNSILNTDSGFSLTNNYVAYRVTNNTGSSLDDVWIKIGGFSGPKIGLASYGSDTHHVGPLAAGASTNVFFYLKSSGATVSSETHNLFVYDGSPGAGVAATCQKSFSMTSQETIKAAANKVTQVTSSSSIQIGSLFVITVRGESGQMNPTGTIALTPAALDSWRADIFQLVSTSVTVSNGNTGTYDNTLFLQLPSDSNTDYVATYTFKINGWSNSTTSLSPVAYILSGGNYKHTDTTTAAYASFPPLPAPTSALTLSTAASPTILSSGGTVTYTVSLVNAGGSDVTVDSIQANLPSSPAAVTYTSGSSQLNGNPIADPYDSGSQVTWYSLFTVPANSSINLTFDVVFPNVAGTYSTTTISATGSVQIDSTSTAGDSAPVTTNVYIGVTPTATPIPTNTPLATATSTAVATATATSAATATPTRTSTPTYTATALAATATPTRTSTPTYTATALAATATPTYTATPIGSYTSTATPTATPTHIHTSIPTASATPTLQPSASATGTATPKPTSTPFPLPAGEIAGEVRDTKGAPVPDVVIYLYRDSKQGARPSLAAASEEVGTLSAVTDLNGRYSFKNVTLGAYRLKPDFTGLSFSPENVTIQPGISSPTIEAKEVDIDDAGCTRTRRAEDIVEADDKSRDILEYGLRKAEEYTKLAQMHLRGKRRTELQSKIGKAARKLERSFTYMLHQSEELPKLTLHCTERDECTESSYTETARRYRVHMNHLRKLTFFILRSSRLELAPEVKVPEEALTTITRQIHRKAVKAWTKLPVVTHRCGVDF